MNISSLIDGEQLLLSNDLIEDIKKDIGSRVKSKETNTHVKHVVKTILPGSYSIACMTELRTATNSSASVMKWLLIF